MTLIIAVDHLVSGVYLLLQIWPPGPNLIQHDLIQLNLAMTC